MLPNSHVAPINQVAPAALEDSRALADAFSHFISASTLLEGSYRSLQKEVARLGTELAERNATLRRTLNENERIHATLQQMMDLLPCGVLVLDGSQRIVMINPAGREFLSLGNARVQHIRELLEFSGIDMVSLAAMGGNYIETELATKTASGRWLAVGKQDVSGSKYDRSERGLANLRSIWILRDITANKLAEQQREEARNAVALAEISTILAHEIRNPLAAMELFAGLILDQPEQSAEWIANLRAGIRLMAGTVNNVLCMQCAAAPPLTSLDLATCIRKGLEFIRPVADQAGASLTFEAGGEPLFIYGNIDAIQQMLLNLVSNGIRHTPAGGRIVVSTNQVMRAGCRQALLRVADSGCGIATELLPRLFDSGFSGDGRTPGLGLTVCKRIMTQHRGEIRVSSQIHQGTVFELEFPSL